ncbi:response regulator [Flavobacterium franklandianum]|uniref:Sensory/regulatory protein RpfC n=1 Tax=Flavobacterium franklandianum TaxID=2594430 RepID=A0A553CJF7_9FLAO|nr:response regulator [Flavobacterium franklandianum]TRX20625.1 response regulator [Flavobacterium franklandianum]
MNDNLKILILEDNQYDADLIQRELKKSGFRFTSEIVQTRESYESAFDSFKPDIILSDYSLPSFDGLAAFHIKQKKSPDIPFIIVSGTIGEENVVELLKQGATDYVFKDMGRLALAVRRALEEVAQQRERKRNEKVMKEYLEQYSTMISATLFGFMLTDEKGKLLDVNDAYCGMSGYTKEELLNLSVTDIQAIDNPEEVAEHIQKVMEFGTNQFESKHKSKDGLFFDIEVSMGFLQSKKQFIAFIRDITDRKLSIINLNKKNEQIEAQNQEYIKINNELSFQNDEKEKRAAELVIANKELAFQNNEKEKRAAELVIAKEKAEESDRLKSAFLANMSHEIRTPMNGILGFADLLKEPNLTGKQQKEYIKIIEKSGFRMLNIINDIVDISKIEAGLTEVNLKESNINEQIEYIYTFFKPEVEQKGMQLFFKKSLASKEAVIKTDREKIYAILTNLVKNAIKYTDEGFIEYGYCINTDSKPTELEFFVKDTGIGIPKHRQEAIFERFIQADITDKMAYQGAGLGLSISKAYVEILGGKIWVESEEGKGSTFYFTIPYHTESEEKNLVENLIPDLDEANNYAKNLKILIAEDDKISRMLLTKAIKVFSKEIIEAIDGVEALEACKNNLDIDLVIMDINMPNMNGHEATKQIRQFNKNVIIIAQTAYAFDSDRKEAIDAGCNDFISKPIVKNELLMLINKYFNKDIIN